MPIAKESFSNEQLPFQQNPNASTLENKKSDSPLAPHITLLQDGKLGPMAANRLRSMHGTSAERCREADATSFGTCVVPKIAFVPGCVVITSLS